MKDKEKIILSKNTINSNTNEIDNCDDNLNVNKMTNDILSTVGQKDTLDLLNNNLHAKTLEKLSEIKDKKDREESIDFDSYEINKISEEFLSIIKSSYHSINVVDDIEVTFIDRNKFNSDLCIKIPSLLSKYKGQYGKEVIPNIIKLLEESDLKKSGVITKIEHIGIYINISLGNDFLLNTLQDVFGKSSKYGENDIHKGESIIIDYSSPNVAKHLHAGHIRSTIIGHVLSNLYNSNGYYTHGVNHINDWGGFGFLIEGFNRWKDKLTHFQNKNNMLFYIYTLYRKGEKVSSSIEEYSKLDKKDLENLKKYYGDFLNYENFCLIFNNFVDSSKKKFSCLEKGYEQEVEIWKEMVSWSMDDFNKFYDLLGIHQDYTIGESFYSEYGTNLVMDLVKESKATLYTQDLANRDLHKLNKLLDAEKITEKSFEITKEEILRDIGAYVIELDNFERFVVLKADKSSIYATRDLGSIKYRAQVFNPSRIIYEVGQEQSEHFDKLFKSAKKIGINGIDFTHVYHGFYVDSKTKKKLSSRDGASSVNKLINESIEYFKLKYKNSNFSDNEINDIANKLAIGSIIFNDIKSDKKNPVLISSDIKETCASFEDSGGAYVMYSVARAKSILAKIENIGSINLSNILGYNLDNIEKIIINEINRFPLVIRNAQKNDNPAILVDFILTLSRYYNSYYNSHRVIIGDEIMEGRVIVTKAFIEVIQNAMAICHIDLPDRM